jgi:hypothetical protein
MMFIIVVLIAVYVVMFGVVKFAEKVIAKPQPGRLAETRRQLSSARNHARQRHVQVSDLILPWTVGLVGVVVVLVLRLILSAVGP